MANLNTTQEAHLKTFENEYQVFKNAETMLEATLRERLAVELLGLRVAASTAGNRCKAAGVPISRLGEKGRRGMNTRNWTTITDFLALTEGHSFETAEDLIPKVVRFSLTAPTFPEDENGWLEYLLNVDMAGPDYEAWLPTLAKTHFRYDAADRHKGSFRVGSEGLSLRSIERGDRSTMNKFDLAVTGWLATAGKAEAVAWLAENLHDTREPRVEEEMEE